MLEDLLLIIYNLLQNRFSRISERLLLMVVRQNSGIIGILIQTATCWPAGLRSEMGTNWTSGRGEATGSPVGKGAESAPPPEGRLLPNTPSGCRLNDYQRSAMREAKLFHNQLLNLCVCVGGRGSLNCLIPYLSSGKLKNGDEQRRHACIPSWISICHFP